MSINDFVSFLIVPGLVILYFSMKNLLPNYFNEKGRNLATKEDISEITSLVEEVKHSFTTETEKLKANLLLLTNVYAGIVSEERNAIIDYNEKFFLWLNLVSDISLGHTNKNNNAELDEFEKHIHDVYYNVLNSETKFKLFVNNDDLINLGN